MPALTIKNIPDEVFQRLKHNAELLRNVLALYLRKNLIGLNQALAIQEDAELMRLPT